MAELDLSSIPPYIAHPTLARFHASPAFVRGVRGPFGSGKSSAMCMEILRNALLQEPVGKKGVRHVRWGIVRNTYGDLKETTIKTWTTWFPEEIFGAVRYDLPHTHTIRFLGEDGIPVILEAVFIALDKPQDVRKLKSLELTGAWINEASEILWEAFDLICGRVDRWPKVRRTESGEKVGGATRACVILDTNPPNPEHWLYRLAEEETPPNYEFFVQPPAVLLDPTGPIVSQSGQHYRVNPEAENLDWVSRDGVLYYENFLQGKSDDVIKVYGKGEYGYVAEGRAVYSLYLDDVHFSQTPLIIFEGIPITLMFDFGVHCACVLAQVTPRGQVRIFDELYTEEGLLTLIEMLKATLNNEYPGKACVGWGDPAGKGRAQGVRSAYEELALAGFNILPAPLPTNDFLVRKLAVERLLQRQDGLIIGPRARMIRAGFLGMYRLARAATLDRGQVTYKEVPVKNSYSHPHEALQYGALGIQGGTARPIPDPAMAQAAATIRRPADAHVGY